MSIHFLVFLRIVLLAGYLGASIALMSHIAFSPVGLTTLSPLAFILSWLALPIWLFRVCLSNTDPGLAVLFIGLFI
jgi:hypothetical protein